MGSVNKVILIGNLGADPELKYTPQNVAVATLSMATNEAWKEKDGTKRTKVEWHRVKVWRETAENCHKYLRKGSSVYIEGRLETRSWEDKDKVKRWSTEIIADRVVFLGSAIEKESNGRHREESHTPPGQEQEEVPPWER